MTGADYDPPTMRKATGGVIGGLLAGFGALVVATGAALALSIAPASAEVAITPSIVDFDSQPVGVASAPRRIELMNTGRSTMYVESGEVNSGPDNRDFLATNDGCTGTTLDPGGRCGVDLAFKPMNQGFTSQTFGFSVSGGDYRTLRERAGVVTLNGTGTESGAVSVSVPSRGGRSAAASAVPIGMLIPIAGIGAIGLGMIVLASTGRARRPS